jgi:large subunit ribosomal protein L15
MGTTLHTLKPKAGATKTRKRLGRGHGSGLHKTSGKGTKGQKARTGHHGIPKPGFEGGQTISARRLPKRGFHNMFRREIFAVNIGAVAKRFAAGATVGPEELKDKGLVPRSAALIKILSQGDLGHALTVKAHFFSAAAREKITGAKGTVEVIASKGAAPAEGATA